MFFKEEPKRKSNTTPTKFDMECAETLHKWVVEKLNIKRKWSQKEWANEFRILRKEGPNEKTIRSRLRWFCKHGLIEEYKAPPIRSARSFRKYFHEWLEDSFSRYEKRNPAVKSISEDAMKLVREFTVYVHWPKDSAKQVPATIEAGMINHRKMIEKLKKIAERQNSKDINQIGLRRYIERMLSVWSAKLHFMRVWMRRVHNDVVHWEDWNGQLRYFVFSMRHRWFHGMLIEESKEYCGTDRLYKSLMEALK